MLVQTFSSGLMIRCSRDELERNGIPFEPFDQRAALALVKKALAPARHPLPPHPELQLFVSRTEILIFVHALLPAERPCSLFSSIVS